MGKSHIIFLIQRLCTKRPNYVKKIHLLWKVEKNIPISLKNQQAMTVLVMMIMQINDMKAKCLIFYQYHYYQQVYLVAHSGPGVEERQNAGGAAATGGGELSPNANGRLVHVIQSFSDVIAGQFYGHRHTDTFRLMYHKGRFAHKAF